YLARDGAAVERDQYNLFAVVIAYCVSRHDHAGGNLSLFLVFLAEKANVGVLFGTQIIVRIENLDLHLHGRFLAVTLGRDLIDHALVLAIGISVSGHHCTLLWAELGEIVLADVEFNLQVREIGKSHDRTTRSSRISCAGKLRRDKLALFRRAL